MHLEPTDDQRALRDSVREVLARECPPSVVRATVEKGTPATALWEQAVALGWTGLTLPEDRGGAGLGPLEVAVVAEELGWAAAPLPWLATVTQYAAVVAGAGTPEQAQPLLARLLEGGTGTLAVSEDPIDLLPRLPAVQAEPTSAGWQLTGTKVAVVDAVTADQFVVIAAVGPRLAAFVVPRADLQVVPVRCVDATRPWAMVLLAGVQVSPDCSLGDPGSADTDAAVRRGLDLAVSALAAESVGVCRALLSTTLAYVRVREQFGRPVGSFQAVQHRLVDAHLATERARACATYSALCLAERSDQSALATAAAAVAAGDAAQRVAGDALQAHGGIGYTWESDLHLWLKRARANAALLGTPAAQRQRVADLLRLPA